MTTASTDDATTAVVDEDYQFRLAWPGPGWKMLREADARRINPAASAAAMSDGVNVVVIAERLGEVDLDVVTRVYMDGLAIVGEHGRPQAYEVDGRPERRYRVEGTLTGAPAEITGRVLLRDGFAYHVFAVQTGSSVAPSVVTAALEGFVLTAGTPRVRVRADLLGDQRGVGWRLRQGRLEHGPARLAMTVPATWRVASTREATQLNPSAAIALMSTHGAGLILVLTEPAPAAGVDELFAARRANATQDWDLEGASSPGTIGGRPVEIWRGIVKGGALSGGLVTTAVDGVAYQFVWVHAVGDREAAAQVAEALAAFEFLDRDATAALVAELRAAPSAEEFIGVDHVFRDGEYRDYAHRFRWSLPPGLWRVFVGDVVRAHSKNAQLIAHELLTGVNVELVAEPWPREPWLFDEAIAKLYAGRPRRGTGFTEIDAGQGRYFDFTDPTAKPVRQARVVLAKGVGRAAQVVISAPTDAWASADLESISRGFRFDDELVAISPGPPYRDDRFGVEIKLRSDWRSEVPPPAPHPLVTLAQWRRGDSSLFYVGVAAVSEDRAWAESFIEQLVRSEYGALMGGRPTRTDTVVSGRPAGRLRWGDRLEVTWVQRDGSWMAVAANGADAIADARAGFAVDRPPAL